MLKSFFDKFNFKNNLLLKLGRKLAIFLNLTTLFEKLQNIFWCNFCDSTSISFIVISFHQIPLTWWNAYSSRMLASTLHSLQVKWIFVSNLWKCFHQKISIWQSWFNQSFSPWSIRMDQGVKYLVFGFWSSRSLRTSELSFVQFVYILRKVRLLSNFLIIKFPMMSNKA